MSGTSNQNQSYRDGVWNSFFHILPSLYPSSFCRNANPQYACTRGLQYLVSVCVCVCVCLFVSGYSSNTGYKVACKSDTNSFKTITSEEIKGNFSEMGVFKSYGMKTSEKPIICIIGLG